jgi:hypothetical protein
MYHRTSTNDSIQVQDLLTLTAGISIGDSNNSNCAQNIIDAIVTCICADFHNG